jgi:hypothetical protein
MTSVGTLMRQAAFNDQIRVDGQAVSRSHVLASRTTSPMVAENMWLTGARWGEVGRVRLSVSYVPKKMAASIDLGKVGSLSRRKCFFLHEHTSWGAPNNDTTDAIVYPSKSPCLVKTVIRLQTCLYRVYRVE